MSETTTKIEWFIARDGQQHGPLSADELDKFIELGHMRPTDLLWRAGFDDWRGAAEVFPPLPPKEPARPAAPAAPSTTNAPAEHAARMIQNQAAAGPDNGRAKADGGEPAHNPQAAQRQPARSETQHRDHNAAANTGPHELQRVADPGTVKAAAMRTAAGVGNAQSPAVGSPSAVTQRPASHPQFGPAAGAAQHGRSDRQPSRTGQARINVARPVAVSASTDDMDDDAYLDDEPAGRSGWLMVAAALFVFVILGAGGLFAYNNKAMIASFYGDLAGKAKPRDVAVIRAPERAAREPAAATERPAVAVRLNQTEPPTLPEAPKAAAPTPKALPELPILKSKLWQFAEREFGEWTEKRIEYVRQLSVQDKPKEEVNKYLIESFVKFRRDNAAVALLASPDKLAQIAQAFVESLQALTAKGPNACYAFISNGETTPEVAPLYFEAKTGAKLEAQMLAIMQAIADGKASPTSNRKPPSAADFNKLSTELGRRGWTASDLKLFSDPNALSKAKPEVVCRLVTEWFATQTKLADQTARDQLIAASLRPVIGG